MRTSIACGSGTGAPHTARRAALEAAVLEVANGPAELHAVFVLETTIGSIRDEELDARPRYLDRLERYVRSEVDAVLGRPRARSFTSRHISKQGSSAYVYHYEPALRLDRGDSAIFN